MLCPSCFIELGRLVGSKLTDDEQEVLIDQIVKTLETFRVHRAFLEKNPQFKKNGGGCDGASKV